MFDSPAERFLTYPLASAYDCWGRRRPLRCGARGGVWFLDATELDQPRPSTDFELQRAYILSLNRRGDLETRLVAVHPALGIVGTRTVHRFHTRWSALATRCGEHLAGAIDLFPARERPMRTSRIQIPVGEANLTFESGTKPLPRRDVDPQNDAVEEAKNAI